MLDVKSSARGRWPRSNHRRSAPKAWLVLELSKDRVCWPRDALGRGADDELITRIDDDGFDAAHRTFYDFFDADPADQIPVRPDRRQRCRQGLTDFEPLKPNTASSSFSLMLALMQ